MRADNGDHARSRKPPVSSTKNAGGVSRPTTRTASPSKAHTSPSTSFAAIAGMFKMAAVYLAHGELSTIEEGILDELESTEWRSPLVSTGIYFRIGHLVVDFKDQDTVNWLLKVGNKLMSWKGPPLCVKVREDLPAPLTIRVYYPGVTTGPTKAY